MPADTVRAWERRYGLPTPARTAGNQRLYSDRDIATIVWLRDQTRAGLTISQAVRLYRDRERSLPTTAIDPLTASDPLQPSAEVRMARFASEVVDSLVGYDAAGAGRVIEEALALMPVEDVCLHLLQPALAAIVRRRQRGEIGVCAEHFARAFVLRKLGALFNLSQPEHGRGPIVAASLEDELHEVGLLLTCLFLSRAGFQIVYLGPSIPLNDLIQTVESLRPSLVLLSASTPEAAADLATATRELSARCATTGSTPPWVPTVGFGGHVFVARPELRAAVTGTYLGPNAAAAVPAVERLLVELV